MPVNNARWTGWLMAALVAACGPVDDEADDVSEVEAATPVAAIETAPRDLSRRITVSAPVESRTRVRLASRSDGTVDSVSVEEGDRVEVGTILAELDKSEQRAQLRRARAREDEARREYERMVELRERGVISPAEYQRSLAAVEVAESERQLNETRLEFATIRAPLGAVVTERHIEPGEGVQARETLFVLADMERLVVRPGLSEMDVVHLDRGERVSVVLDAMRERPLEGEVTRIFPAADRDSRLVTVEVALPAEALEQGVRPGFLARVRMVVDERPQALAVPSAAVGEDGDSRHVYVVEDNILRLRRVETGVTRGQWTQILSGLEAGEVVLATNPIDMSDGQRVRIVGWRG